MAESFMTKKQHMVVWLVPGMLFTLLEALFFFSKEFPRMYFLFLFFSLSLSLFGTRVIVGRVSRDFFLYSIVPLFFTLSIFLFALFLEGKYTPHLMLIILLLLGVFYENLYLRFHERERYQEYTMGNILSFLSVLIVYLFSAAMFGYGVYIDFPIWISQSFIMGLSFLLTYQVLEHHSVPLQKSWTYLIALTLSLGEFFWIINFLPSSIYVNAYILTVLHYVLLGVARNHLLGILNRSVVLRYMSIALASLAIVFGTAKWA